MDARRAAILSRIDRPTRSVAFPSAAHDPSRNATPSELFGENVFSLRAMADALPKPVYAQFLRQRRGRHQMDKATADAVAHAVRVWAMQRGATHYTHWFQPQTDATAEKHDSFLAIKASSDGGMHAIDTFSGSQLLQSEPDASSFPSGGMRTTFEARGYTIWDTTSPMFVRDAPNGTRVLYIPSVFISYNGESLDEKTVLLRSGSALSQAAVELLDLLDPAPRGHPPYVQYVSTTLGTEQEFFLIDRALFNLRPDLKMSGRTLLGSLPPRHQQLEDHYFGKVPSRVLAVMSEAELELLRLGVPLKTRHNEVAPSQFEVAPVFEEASVAVDHNLLTMDVLAKVAHRHKLRALFHEKPFAGVNGSGKHCNWSMATERGENLLNPTDKPETNYRFLLFLVAVLNAVHKHGGLLRAGIASASNDHRLGANEAPPGIISVFLGEQLSEVLDAIEENREVKSFSQPEMHAIKIGGTVLDLKVATLPNIDRDLTDRNRTSPFAFTGNKFEFRAVGSKQSPSFPMTLLNAAVASSIREVTAKLRECAKEDGRPYPNDADKLTAIRHFIKVSKPIRFEGDNYSQAWADEAARRGLPNIRDAPTAFAQLQHKEHAEMLVSMGVFSRDELHSRYHILMEKYIKDVLIEANTLAHMVRTQVLPALFEYRKMLADTCLSLHQCGLKDGDEPLPEEALLAATGKRAATVQRLISKLDELITELENATDDADDKDKVPAKAANLARHKLLPVMEEIRVEVDYLEEWCGDRMWPLPRYTEMLFS